MQYQPLNSARGTIKRILLNGRLFNEPISFDQQIINFNDVIAIFEEHCPEIEFWFILPQDKNQDAQEIESGLFRIFQHKKKKNCFGFKIDISIPELLKELVSVNGNSTTFDADIANLRLLGTDWVQDPFFVLETRHGYPALLDPYYWWKDIVTLESNEEEFRGIAELVNGYLPAIISSQTGVLTRACRYYFEGGNIIGGEGFVFAGLDIATKNFEHYFPNSFNSKKVWKKEFGKFMKDLAFSFHSKHVICPGLNLVRDFLITFEFEAASLNHLDQYFLFAGRYPGRKDTYHIGLGCVYEWVGSENSWKEKDPRTSGRQQFLKILKNWFENPISYGVNIPYSFVVFEIPIFERGDSVLFGANCHLSTYWGLTKAFVAKAEFDETENPDINTKANNMIAAAYASVDIMVVPISSTALPRSGNQNDGVHCLSKVLSRSWD